MITIVPIFICVVLPVSIVLIVFLTAMNSDNKRAQILIKAIESGNNIDTDKLAEALRKPRKTDRQILNVRLLRGCIGTFAGVAFAIVGIINYFSCYNFTADPVTCPLMIAAICLSIGVSYLIVYFVTRKQVK